VVVENAIPKGAGARRAAFPAGFPKQTGVAPGFWWYQSTPTEEEKPNKPTRNRMHPDSNST
jgi:hypothetical protein